MTRTIQAPGIELHEVDKSQYGQKTDYSLVDTASLILGFADEGEDYTTQWINSKQTLDATYGKPQNEPEKYFYNAAIEILNKGGLCLMSKLPYDNAAKDKFTCTSYKFDPEVKPIIGSPLSALASLDSHLTSYQQLSSLPVEKSTKISMEDLDKLRVRATSLQQNTIKIVDISRCRYQVIETSCVQSIIDPAVDNISAVNTDDCLGIVPVIVTPANAIYFQNILNAQLPQADVTAYNNVDWFQTVYNGGKIKQDFTKLISENMILDLDSKFDISSDYEPSESWSKVTSKLFPDIVSMNNGHLDPTYLKSIGVVVLRAYADTADKNYLNFEVLESFVGSLDKNAKDAATGATTFIDTVVNNSSRYINFFSNIRSQDLSKSKLLAISNQTVTSLGFYEIDLTKKISEVASIVQPMQTIFKADQDPNKVKIDLVVDAGITTLAQLVHNHGGSIDFTYDSAIKDYDWTLNVAPSRWLSVAKMFDDFCKSTRRDCIFLCDAPRPFCVVGDSKVVRSTDINSSVEKDIVPKLKYLTGMNSSYSAGYCDWFYQQDASTGDFFWCPPSIKAAGIYTYTDAYFHKWDAPAGMTRGVVKNVVDCAFSPTQDEAGKVYSQSWNYAINYPINGIVLEGQRTFQIKKTAFDRVNVRRLFLHLEKTISRIAQRFLYEGHTPYLRQRFVDTIRPILNEAVEGQGILQYYIQCDENNNPPEAIDRNELHCSIAIKPVKTIEFIVLNFICTSQSANVTETIAK